jgi:hypothetical protein
MVVAEFVRADLRLEQFVVELIKCALDGCTEFDLVRR